MCALPAFPEQIMCLLIDGCTHVHRPILGPQMIIKGSSRFPTSKVSDHLWRLGTRQFHGISSHQRYPSFKWTFAQCLSSSQLPLFVGFSVSFVIIGFPGTAASSNSTLDGVSARSPPCQGTDTSVGCVLQSDNLHEGTGRIWL